MRVFCSNFYRLAHRTAGVYAGLTTLGFLASVPWQLEAGRHVIVPIVISLIALAAAAVLTWPKLMPDWAAERFSRPSAMRDLPAVLLGNALLPLLFVVPSMGLVMALGLSGHLTREFAILSASIPFMLFAISWCIGLLLCFWPDRRQSEGGDSVVRHPSRTLPLLGRHRRA